MVVAGLVASTSLAIPQVISNFGGEGLVIELLANAIDGLCIAARECIVSAVIAEFVFDCILDTLALARRVRILNPLCERILVAFAQCGRGQKAERSGGHHEGTHPGRLGEKKKSQAIEN